MKLYIAAGVYVGTQAEAKKLDRDFTPVEVPTDKEGLIAYLNEATEAKTIAVPHSFADEDISDLLGDDEPAVEEVLSAKVVVAPKVSVAPALTPEAVLDWVLDTASPPQIETIFAGLGARFHEAVKGQDND